eukprot:763423-Hanusia_phi.AAC.2
MLPAIARLLSGDFRKMAEKEQRPQMVTIPFSHYVEFARWCLLYKQVQFDEHAFAPGDHVLPVLSVRLGDKEETEEKGDKEDKKAKMTLVPLVVLPEGKLLRDSWSIAEGLSELGGIQEDLKDFLDNQWGPQTREFAYTFLLSKNNTGVWKDLITFEGGWWMQLKFHVFMDPFLRSHFRSTIHPDDPEALKALLSKMKSSREPRD